MEELLNKFDEIFGTEEMADSWDYSELHEFKDLSIYKRIKDFLKQTYEQGRRNALQEYHEQQGERKP